MKALSFALLLMACVAFVLAGCSDNPGSAGVSTPSDENTTVSLGKYPGPGAWVSKYGAEYYAYFTDENTGWLVLFGVNDLSSACAGIGGLDWFTLNDIYLPNADPTLRRNVYQLFGHDVTAMAWHSINANMCEDPPEAVGTANFINTDNDYYAPDQDNRNANAWGYKATGTLTGPDGQVYKLNLVYRISWDGVDGTRRNTVFKVQMTPTGGK